jgi:hypothetical protein
VRADQCVSAVRAVGVPVLVCLRSGRDHVTEIGGREVCETGAEGCQAKDRDLVDIILL